MAQRNYEDQCGDHGGNNGTCGLPAGWGTDFDSGKCKHHRGTSPDGTSHEENTNAVTHGAYADRKKLYAEEFSDREQDLVDRVFDDYHGRYIAVHGDEPPLGFTMRLFNIAVNVVTEMRVENWFTDQPDDLDTGTPQIDKETHISEGGQRYYRYKKSPSQAAVKHLSDYNRQWLKTLGLDPGAQDDGTTVNVNVHEEMLSGLKAAHADDP